MPIIGMSKSIIKNTIAKMTLNVFNIIVPILIYPYIYRVLSAKSVGFIDYSTTLYTYFSLVGLLGIYNYGLREISRYRDNHVKTFWVFRNLFVIGLISNIIISILYYLFVFFLIKDPILKKIMYVQGIMIIGQVFYIEWMNEAHEDYGFITIKTIIIRILSIFSIFVFVTSNKDYYIYVIITSITYIINNVISFIHVKKFITLNPKQLFQHLDLLPFLPSLFLILILNNTNLLYTIADKTILGTFFNAESVAYYGVGQKVSEMIRILFLSLVSVTIPRMSYYLENDSTAYKQGIIRLTRTTILTIAPVVFGVYALSDNIVLLFSGEQYLAAIPTLKIFAFRIIVISTEAIIYNQIIFLFRKEKFLMLINAGCGLLNVLLDLIFLKILTPEIAVATTIFCEIIFQIICLIYIKKTLNIETGLLKSYNLRYILLSLFFIPIILFIKNNMHNTISIIIVSILSCACFYISVLYLIKDDMAQQLFHRLTHKKDI